MWNEEEIVILCFVLERFGWGGGREGKFFFEKEVMIVDRIEDRIYGFYL